VLPGGLGAHKWVDRDLLAGHEPLIVDLSGEVLESGSGNVFLVEGDTLVTPPADGRILPGVTRARLLASGAGAAEAPVSLPAFEAAPRRLLSSAIAGTRPLLGAMGRR
jgi:para-aminobenzoate synthetase/4-amino-4-deoxychorismate lyase